MPAFKYLNYLFLSNRQAENSIFYTTLQSESQAPTGKVAEQACLKGKHMA
jgi:hypothetical protein